MTESNLLWIGIRGLGLYFLARAVLLIAKLPGYLVSIVLLREAVRGMGKATPGFEDAPGTSILASLIADLVVAVIYGSVGFYLAKKGRRLHQFIAISETAEKTAGTDSMT